MRENMERKKKRSGRGNGGEDGAKVDTEEREDEENQEEVDPRACWKSKVLKKREDKRLVNRQMKTIIPTILWESHKQYTTTQTISCSWLTGKQLSTQQFKLLFCL